ncbi:MAG: DNA polymerase IV [Gammaproteobacteria bacterium]|nr:DNA polymerase IV [Pseudomonadales bacterium]MCP5345616.1 DNA polymerase IV [Pseudomonadales bacterium]
MSVIRKIVHIDCDCFYASIETRDNPALAALPIAVGGAPERRGVIATCNYLARQFGIHSAMASATARRLCPDLIIIRPDIARYRQVSEQIHDIFRDYTNLIEPLSLDEAYLDLTANDRHDGSASRTAAEIRARIAGEIQITVSAGIAPNKFLAKIASDWNKPNGQFVIEPGQVGGFLKELPVQKLHGVGKVTAARLHRLGIQTCADLRALNRSELSRAFGSFGNRLYELSRGIDNRPVQPSRIRKSVSVENTFAADLPDQQACLDALPGLLQQLERRLNGLHGQYRITGQVVKLKFNDFVSTTVETRSVHADPGQYQELLKAGFERGSRPVRLVGIGVRVAPAAIQAPAPATGTDDLIPDSAPHDGQLALFKD